jgi:hypothetical protein
MPQITQKIFLPFSGVVSSGMVWQPVKKADMSKRQFYVKSLYLKDL